MSSDNIRKTNENLISNVNYQEKEHFEYNQGDKDLAKPTLLLHSCCGPCSTSVIETLCADFQITIYFYNPNITNEEEYCKRKNAQREFINEFNQSPEWPYMVGYKEGPWDKKEFLKVAEPFASCEEGGRRCEECFKLRLEKTAETASMLGFDYFGTTLSVSPHKDVKLINSLGKKIGAIYKVGFYEGNFKKKNGYLRSIELSKKYGIYRQNYCGCDYSKR